MQEKIQSNDVDEWLATQIGISLSNFYFATMTKDSPDMDTLNSLIKMFRPLRGIEFSLREEEIKLYSECTGQSVDNVRTHVLTKYEAAHNEFDRLKQKLIDSFHSEDATESIKLSSSKGKRKLRSLSEASSARPTTGMLRVLTAKQKAEANVENFIPIVPLAKDPNDPKYKVSMQEPSSASATTPSTETRESDLITYEEMRTNKHPGEIKTIELIRDLGKGDFELHLKRDNDSGETYSRIKLNVFGYEEVESMVKILKKKPYHTRDEFNFLKSCQSFFNSMMRYEKLYRMKATRFPDTTPHQSRQEYEAQRKLQQQQSKKQRTK